MTEPNEASAAGLTTSTLDVPGASLAYDVREAATEGDRPTLLLIGSPMGAAGFGSLASYFTDRRVVTYDPRGVERSTRADPGAEQTAEEHAADLAALVEAVGGGPVDVFASSGGAINALVWVTRRPDQVCTLVAHEPPLVHVLPDAEHVTAVVEDMYRTYQESGMGPAMAKFIAFVMYDGEVGPDYLARPAPDPATFGLPTEDDGSRDDPMLGQNLRGGTGFRVDLDALRAAPCRVVLARGEESGQTMAARGADATAALIGSEPVVFPSGHAGFLDGEYGQTGQVVPFAHRLRVILDG